MKGYKNIDKLESRLVIESFEIVGDKIILHMHNGKKIEYEYTEENLNLVNKMQENTCAKFNFKELRANEHKAGQVAMISNCIISVTGVLLAPVYILTSQSIYLLLFLGIGSFVLTASGISLGILSKRKNDLEKQEMYMEMKDELDDDTLNNENIAKCLSKKKREAMLEQKELTHSTFNLTSIDKLSLKDLRKMKEAFACEKTIDLEASNNESFQYIK